MVPPTQQPPQRRDSQVFVFALTKGIQSCAATLTLHLPCLLLFTWVHPFTFQLEKRLFVRVNEGIMPKTLMARQELVCRDFFSSELNTSDSNVQAIFKTGCPKVLFI